MALPSLGCVISILLQCQKGFLPYSGAFKHNFMLQESGGVNLWDTSMLCKSTCVSFDQAQTPCFFNDNKMTTALTRGEYHLALTRSRSLKIFVKYSIRHVLFSVSMHCLQQNFSWQPFYGQAFSKCNCSNLQLTYL